MVKADVKRDYYADLELPYGASADEVKKQFRKLAKLYHPDRNPGKEVEFISKFQAIQAAHEILTDPEQKQKYDADRKKAGLHTTPAKPAGPSRTTTTNFPPPPRRTPRESKDAYPAAGVHKPPPSAGAQRYARWARAGAQEWQNAKEEAQSRADAFRGFAEMKNGQNRGAPPPPPGRSRYVPTAQRPVSSHGTTQNATPKQTTGWDSSTAGNAGSPEMSRGQSTRRKQGFDPSTPNGDEHMAGTSAYAGLRRGQQPQASQGDTAYFSNRASAAYPNEKRTKPVTSPLRHAKSHEDSPSSRPGLARQSTKYATSGGERTSLFGPGLGRSASVRNSPTEHRYDDHASHDPNLRYGAARFRSASPGFRRPAAAAMYSDESSSSESSSEAEDFDTSNRPKATPRLNRTRTAFPQSHEGSLHSPRDESPSYDYPPPPHHNKPFYPDLNSASHYDNAYHSKSSTVDENKDNPSLYDKNSLSYPYLWSQKGYSPWKGTLLSSKQKVPGSGLSYSLSTDALRKDRSPSLLKTIFEETCARISREGNFPFQRTSPLLNVAHHGSPADFFKPHSTASASATSELPKAFSASEWDGKFGADAFAPTPNSEQDRRSPLKGSRRGTAQSYGRQASPGNLGTSAATDASTGSTTMPAFQPARFDADKWAEQLKDQTWATPQPDLVQAKTPKRSARSNASTSRKPVQPKTSSTGSREEEKEVPATPTANGEVPEPAAVDEMDIDAPQEASQPSDSIPNRRTAETVSEAEPSSSSVNLDDLRQVHPLKPSRTGLGDLEDLSSTLPFESKPAHSVNLEEPSSALTRIRDLKLPKPPKPPTAPPEESVSPGRWVSYANSMAAYMKEWSKFNRNILEHFAIRQTQMDHQMANNWISAIGDGPTDLAVLGKTSGAQAGYKAYMIWVEQDAAVREWWSVACERHRTAMMDLGRIREKMKATSMRGAA